MTAHAPALPFISVVVPVFNAELYLARCFDALVAQEYPDSRYEVILVDNNSTDNSTAIAARYARVRILAETKQSAYAARNTGIRAAKGEVIAFTDPDCVADSRWLSAIAEAMQPPEVAIVLGSYDFSALPRALSLMGDYERERQSYIFSSGKTELYYGYTNNMAVRRKCLEEVGLFEECDRGGDVILLQRCLSRCSSTAIRHSREMRVRHLEVDSLRMLFAKQYVYGASSRRFEQQCSWQPMNLQTRLLVLSNFLQRRRLGLLEAPLLLLLLCIGSAVWQWGRLRGGNRRQRPNR